MSTLKRSRFDTLLFEQEAVPWRLAYMRVALGSSVTVLAVYGPFDRFFSDNVWLYDPGGLFAKVPVLGAASLAALRMTTIVASLMLAAGACTRVSAWLTALSFFLLNGYTAQFTQPSFNYDTHLNLFLLAIASADSGRVLSLDAHWRSSAPTADERAGSVALGFMQIYVAMLYGQAFLAKLLLSGPAWFWTGDVVLVQTLRIGTGFGRWLSRWPDVFRAIGILTGVFELSVGWALLRGGRVRNAGAGAALAFHFGTWLVLGISFWHLVVLLPPLFLLRGPTRESARAAERLPGGTQALTD